MPALSIDGVRVVLGIGGTADDLGNFPGVELDQRARRIQADGTDQQAHDRTVGRVRHALLKHRDGGVRGVFHVITRQQFDEASRHCNDPRLQRGWAQAAVRRRRHVLLQVGVQCFVHQHGVHHPGGARARECGRRRGGRPGKLAQLVDTELWHHQPDPCSAGWIQPSHTGDPEIVQERSHHHPRQQSLVVAHLAGHAEDQEGGVHGARSVVCSHRAQGGSDQEARVLDRDEIGELLCDAPHTRGHA